MHKIYFLIGASGVGKTTAVISLEKRRNDIKFIYEDREKNKESIVLSKEEIIKLFGSIENWQKNNTIERVKKLKKSILIVHRYY